MEHKEERDLGELTCALCDSDTGGDGSLLVEPRVDHQS